MAFVRLRVFDQQFEPVARIDKGKIMVADKRGRVLQSDIAEFVRAEGHYLHRNEVQSDPARRRTGPIFEIDRRKLRLCI